jgi:phosphatidylserine decarboxylase
VLARVPSNAVHRHCCPSKCIENRANLRVEVQIVVNSSLDVLSVNKRVVVELAGAPCGTVLMVIIGAAAVGSIIVTSDVGAKLAKGQELGYFAYGGSSVVTLFKKGRLRFDRDLRERASQGVETLVRTGSSLGLAPASNGAAAEE